MHFRTSASARPRWEMAFFSSAESSANDFAYPSGMKSGSYPKPPPDAEKLYELVRAGTRVIIEP